MSELSPEAREQLARGLYGPLAWDLPPDESLDHYSRRIAAALAPTVAGIVTAAVEAERARIVSAVEAVIGQWPINPPDMPLGRGTEYRNAVTQCANAVRAALASAAPALDAVKAEALREAADEAEAVIADGDCAEVAAPVPGEVGRAAVVARRDALYEEPHTWLRDRADRIARGSRATAETEHADEAFERNALAQELAGETEA